jgi:hypothetical protein
VDVGENVGVLVVAAHTASSAAGLKVPAEPSAEETTKPLAVNAYTGATGDPTLDWEKPVLRASVMEGAVVAHASQLPAVSVKSAPTLAVFVVAVVAVTAPPRVAQGEPNATVYSQGWLYVVLVAWLSFLHEVCSSPFVVTSSAGFVCRLVERVIAFEVPVAAAAVPPALAAQPDVRARATVGIVVHWLQLAPFESAIDAKSAGTSTAPLAVTLDVVARVIDAPPGPHEQTPPAKVTSYVQAAAAATVSGEEWVQACWPVPPLTMVMEGAL